MAKHKITTAKKALKKGLVKEGDKVWVEATIFELYKYEMLIGTIEGARIFASKTKIRIPIHEPKAIDFGEAGRVLKYGTTVIITTGFSGSMNRFSGYVLESEVYDKGYTNNDWPFSNDWQDITETYKP